jgi:PAS domain S-box-containing protein
MAEISGAEKPVRSTGRKKVAKDKGTEVAELKKQISVLKEELRSRQEELAAHAGKIEAGADCIIDITEHNRDKKTLDTTLQRFYTILSGIYPGILLVTAENRVEFANQVFCDYFDLEESPGDMVGLAASEMIEKIKAVYLHPDAETARIREIVDRGQTVRCEEVSLRHGRTCLRDYVPLTIDGQCRGRLWLHLDITERKRTETEREQYLAQLKERSVELQDANKELEIKTKELATQAEELESANEELRSNNEELQTVTGSLRESGDYLNSLISYANAPIIVWDTGSIITRFNRAFERLSGYAASEVVGMDLSILFPADRRMEALGKIKLTLAGEHWESVEIPILHKEGGVRIALWNSANIYDADKKLLATIAQGQDITERKLVESELAEAKAQAELYLDLMGHDISNLHQIMMMQLEIAEDMLVTNGILTGEDKDVIDTPLKTLEKATRLIDNVRKLQKLRAGEYQMESVDLSLTLDEVIKTYAKIPGREITINYVLCPGCLVWANPLLKDIFSNLLDNAVKHSSGQLEVRVEVDRADPNGSAYYRVMIEDNGNGIPDDRKDEIFQRFRRGQTKAKGTGLGLYLVKSLVEGFGGRVEVRNKVPGNYTKGTRFSVYLPVIGEEKDTAE